MSFRSLRFVVLASGVLSLSALAIGCGATVTPADGEDTDGEDTCEGAGCEQEDACPAAEPSPDDSCDVDGVLCSYETSPGSGCFNQYRCTPVYPEAGAPSEFLFESTDGDCEQCTADPSCGPGETQVDSCEGIDPAQFDCHSESACGSTIYCILSTCDLQPSCDPGDTLTPQCPPDAGCYTIEVCGQIHTCRDDALPQHGCPPSEPSDGALCGSAPEFCDYDSGDGCFSSYGCDDAGRWFFAGGGCDG